MRQLVSIVIPVYNTSNYLKRCVESCINQTYSNIEIILIDDGSTDDSLNILKSLKNKYKNSSINIYSQKNHGVSYTRNRGIELAKGEYITFLDSDDYLDYDFIDILYSNVEEYDAVFVGHQIVNDNRIIKKNHVKSGEWSKYKYNSTCSKLYRLSVIKNNNIRYPNYKIGEDLFFNVIFVLTTNRIKIVDYCGYNYYQNQLSVTQNIKYQNDITYLFEDLLKEIKKRKLEFNKKEMVHFIIKTGIASTLQHRCLLKAKELNDYFKKIVELSLKIDNSISFFNYKEESLINRLIINIFILFYKLHISKLLFILMKLF